MNILFVCKHNRFRSKVAEALFLIDNKNKSIKAKSAGIVLDFTRPYIADNVKKVLEGKGIKNFDEKIRKINSFDIKWADKIIVVGDNINQGIFPKEKVIMWKIRDADEGDLEMIRKIINQIEEKVESLIRNISKV